MHKVLIFTTNASLSEAIYNFVATEKYVLMQRQLLTVGLSCRHVLVVGRCTLFKKEPFPISRFSEKRNIFKSENEGIRATHPPSRQQDYALTEVLHCQSDELLLGTLAR